MTKLVIISTAAVLTIFVRQAGKVATAAKFVVMELLDQTVPFLVIVLIIIRVSDSMATVLQVFVLQGGKVITAAQVKFNSAIR